MEDVGAEPQSLALHLVRVVDVLQRLQPDDLVGGEVRQEQPLDLLEGQRLLGHRARAAEFLHVDGPAGGDD